MKYGKQLKRNSYGPWMDKYLVSSWVTPNAGVVRCIARCSISTATFLCLEYNINTTAQKLPLNQQRPVCVCLVQFFCCFKLLLAVRVLRIDGACTRLRRQRYESQLASTRRRSFLNPRFAKKFTKNCRIRREKGTKDNGVDVQLRITCRQVPRARCICIPR